MMNRYTRMAISGVLAAGLTFCTGALLAQQDGPPPDAAGQGPGGGRMGRGPMNPDEQLARMTKRYNLSTDQQSQVKPILADQQQQMQALRGDSSLSREDRMAKMQTIREGSSTKITAILNDSQKKQFAEDQQRMQERMQQRMHGGDGPPPPQQ